MATDSGDETVPGIGLPPEVLADILGSSQRRAMLDCLAEHGEMVVDDLAACVESGHSTDERAPGDTAVTTRDELYEDHLPKLMATGLVRYDSMRESVELLVPAIADHVEKRRRAGEID